MNTYFQLNYLFIHITQLNSLSKNKYIQHVNMVSVQLRFQLFLIIINIMYSSIKL